MGYVLILEIDIESFLNCFNIIVNKAGNNLIYLGGYSLMKINKLLNLKVTSLSLGSINLTLDLG